MHHLPDGYVTPGYRAVSYWSDAPILLKLIASVPNNHFRRLTARVAIRKGVVALVPDQFDFEVRDNAAVPDSVGLKSDLVTYIPSDADSVTFKANSTMRPVRGRKFGRRKKRN